MHESTDIFPSISICSTFDNEKDTYHLSIQHTLLIEHKSRIPSDFVLNMLFDLRIKPVISNYIYLDTAM